MMRRPRSCYRLSRSDLQGSPEQIERALRDDELNHAVANERRGDVVGLVRDDVYCAGAASLGDGSPRLPPATL